MAKAKTKAAKTTNANSTQAAPASAATSLVATAQQAMLVNASIAIRTDDVVACGVAQIERQLRDREQAARQAAVAAAAEAAAARTAAAAIVTRRVAELTAVHCQQLTAAVEGLGGKLANVTTATGRPLLAASPARTATVSVTTHVKVVSPSGSAVVDGSLSLSGTVTLPAEWVAQTEAETAARAAQEKAEQQALHWRRKLGEIGMIERQVRGALAAQSLQQTAEGAAVLASLQFDVTQGVLALPDSLQ